MKNDQDVIREYRGLDDAGREAVCKALDLKPLDKLAPVPPPSVDVVPSLQVLLRGVSMLGTADEQKDSAGITGMFKGSATGIAAVESTATSFAKWWAAAVGGGGALAGITAAWRAAATDFWANSTDGVHISAILGVALCLVAVVMSIALIVSADLRARSAASAAQYQARGNIASAYLASDEKHGGPSAQQLAIEGFIAASKAIHKQAHVKQAHEEFNIDDCRQADGHVEVRRSGTQTWTPLADGVEISLVPA